MPSHYLSREASRARIKKWLIVQADKLDQCGLTDNWQPVLRCHRALPRHVRRAINYAWLENTHDAVFAAHVESLCNDPVVP